MSPRTPRATYRLQLQPSFDFDRAIEVLDYLAALGVSHVYFAPYLTAVRGSSHGYDVVDPTRVRDDLGGEAGHARLCAALRERGLEQMVDIVPNHMGIDSDDNPWWSDVLENGRTSPFARFFDIDWDADPEGKVVLPILPCELRDALRTGYVRLARDELARPLLRVGDRSLPLAHNSLHDTSEAALSAIADDPHELARVLSRQHYRLAYYRTGLGFVNYRRFLDIASLAALRIEDASVFEATHHRVLEWVRDGKVAAIRVDHPDGLADPEGYFETLRSAAPSAWLVGEKVLSPGEWLPENWALDGTTGYEFLNLVQGLFVWREGLAGLERALESHLGRTPQSFDEVYRESKALVLEQHLEPEVSRVARIVGKRDAQAGLATDLERTKRAVRALVLALDVGRTYARPGTAIAGGEQAAMERARLRAASDAPELAPVIAHVAELVTRPPVDELCLRFQQLSAAAMAKGFEDTALYRHVLLTSLNEIGGDPRRFGHELYELHQFCVRATQTQPRSLLSTSTHDTKRAEDTRLRISMLSELPDAWSSAVEEWRATNAHLRDPLLDPDTEYLLYQTLVGTWPISEERLVAYARKAVREAKLRTNWLEPYVAYERAVSEFVRGMLASADFIASLERFLAPVLRAARIHSLTQTLLKVTCPGVPDVYQGTELWDTSLVDPDNRRPVDFAARRALLAELEAGLHPTDIVARMDEGLPKLWVLRQALALRKERPELLAPTAPYEPLEANDDPHGHVVAFMRGTDCLVIGQRFVLVQERARTAPRLTIPRGTWVNRLSGERVVEGTFDARSLFARFPVALLVRD